MRTQEPEHRPSHQLPAIPHPANPSVAFVSTYPPAVCGLATFTASLRAALARIRGSDRGLGIVALDEDGLGPPEGGAVVAAMDPGDPWSVRSAAERVAGYDVVVLQHEYGIWGPDMGVAVLDFVNRLDNRLITTLHTLLTDPTPMQRRIVESLLRSSSVTVVPTRGARRQLLRDYSIDPRTVAVVPHGTRQPRHAGSVFVRLGDSGGPRLLTWGLIGPGKGIETALEAVAAIRQAHPDVIYTIAGRTHPKVLAHEGEAYRRRLETMARDLGIEANVEFIDKYMPTEDLDVLLLGTDMVLLPYDSTEQMVSGVLVEAVSAHVPVVATGFPHAKELAGVGAVVTTPHRDPRSMARAVSGLLDSPHARNEVIGAQRMVAAELDWDVVARAYEELIELTLLDAAVVSHVSAS